MQSEKPTYITDYLAITNKIIPGRDLNTAHIERELFTSNTVEQNIFNNDSMYSLSEVLSMLMKYNIDKFDNECIRNNPHCQSLEMYSLFSDEENITHSLDVTDFHTKIFGNHIKHLSNFNRIDIDGPKSLVERFIRQNRDERNINIFINSVRPPCDNFEKNKCFFTIPYLYFKDTESYNKNKDNILKELKKYGKANPDIGGVYETPVTLQYCNYYEYFDLKSKEDYYKYFIAIITTKNYVPYYRSLYPHFLIIIQNETTIKTIGYTKNTALMTAFTLNIDRVLATDDNVVNFKIQNYNIEDITDTNKYSTLYLRKLDFLIELFKKDKLKVINNRVEQEIDLNRYGYFGSSSGLSSLCRNDDWVKTSYEKNYFKDYKINDTVKFLKNSIHNYTNKTDTIQEEDIPLFMRDFLNIPHKISEIPPSDFDKESFINPHRSKIIILNTKVLKDHLITFNPLHTSTEDLYFTKQIFLRNLQTNQLSFAYTMPRTDRRPLTCTSVSQCSQVQRIIDGNILDTVSKVSTETNFGLRCDLITYKGGLVIYNNNGILGNCGSYGPAKLLDSDNDNIIQTEINKKIDNNENITADNKEECKKLLNSKEAIYKFNNLSGIVKYIDSTKFKEHIYDPEVIDNDGKQIITYPLLKTFEQRFRNIDKYIKNITNSTSSPIDSEILTAYKQNFIKNYIEYYDIISVKKNNEIDKSTGQIKYVKEYEYENILTHKYFIDFYELNKNFVDKIYTQINTDNLDRCNRNDDISFYFENYDKFPEAICKMINLYVIFTKLKYYSNKIFETINSRPEINDSKTKLMLCFGNINDYMYNMTSDKSIKNILIFILDKTFKELPPNNISVNISITEKCLKNELSLPEGNYNYNDIIKLYL
jgi:hypothetical protein